MVDLSKALVDATYVVITRVQKIIHFEVESILYGKEVSEEQ
jgi:hypothetical protein